MDLVYMVCAAALVVGAIFALRFYRGYFKPQAVGQSDVSDEGILLQEIDEVIDEVLQEHTDTHGVIREVRALLESDDTTALYESLYTLFIKSEGEEKLRLLRGARYLYGCEEHEQAAEVLWELLADKFRVLIGCALEGGDRTAYEEARKLRKEISRPASRAWSTMSFGGVVDRSVIDQSFDFAEQWNDMVLLFEEAPNRNDFVSMPGLSKDRLREIIRLAEEGDRAAVYKAELLYHHREFKDVVLESWFKGVMNDRGHLLSGSDLAGQVAYKIAR